MKALPWVLAGLLALSSAAQAVLLLLPADRFAVLPIFVPVSLEHERAMRQEREQPEGRGGEEAMDLVRALEREPLDPAVRAAVAPTLEDLRATREALLALREERHALNIRLMDVGVTVARELTPAQWDAIHMGRDALRARADRATFERVLGSLR